MKVFNKKNMSVTFEDAISIFDECLYNVNVINDVLNNGTKNNYEEDMLDFMMSFSSKDFTN